MPDPRLLKVGQYVRFTAVPEEWSLPDITVPRSSRSFMRIMIGRRSPSRVYEIDEHGVPWIAARIRRKGRIEHHTWGISESTGWRRVRRRRVRRR